jgi:DNA polymerase-3 subunit gamma/tau
VELVLIRLCYLNQALQLTATDAALEKKKVTETARAVAFKAITPVAIKEAAPKKQDAAPQKEEAKLLIETPTPPAVRSAGEKPEYNPQPAATPVTPAAPKKLSSLEAIRRKVQQENCATIAVDQPLEQQSLTAAWKRFIDLLRDARNPAVQSFELAELIIKDAASFEATASNNINQKFIEFERNRACQFLQKELCNKSLQFSIVLIEAPQEDVPYERPLTSKEQYQKLVEAFPLVKELRERLRLELDY